MWFKVDDSLHSHPKARRAGLEAMGLWAMSGAWSMSYSTDSFVPQWYVQSWPSGPKLAERLVTAGLWEPGVYAGEEGWTFHDWRDYQPSPDQIAAEREKSRERQRRYRERRFAAKQAGDDP